MFINKQRKVKRNQDIFNNTQPVVQEISNDIEINDITPKH